MSLREDDVSPLTYTGRVLKDGKLPVSREAIRALQLRPGDKLKITLRRADRTNGATTIADALPLEELDEAALRKVARTRVSAKVQRRMETLLIKNQDGTLTPDERREMLETNQKSLELTLRKAQATLLLQRRKA